MISTPPSAVWKSHPLNRGSARVYFPPFWPAKSTATLFRDLLWVDRYSAKSLSFTWFRRKGLYFTPNHLPTPFFLIEPSTNFYASLERSLEIHRPTHPQNPLRRFHLSSLWILWSGITVISTYLPPLEPAPRFLRRIYPPGVARSPEQDSISFIFHTVISLSRVYDKILCNWISSSVYICVCIYISLSFYFPSPYSKRHFFTVLNTIRNKSRNEQKKKKEIFFFLFTLDKSLRIYQLILQRLWNFFSDRLRSWLLKNKK